MMFLTGNAGRDAWYVVVGVPFVGTGCGVQLGMATSVAGVDVHVASGRFEKALLVSGSSSGDVCVEFIRHDFGLKLVM
jgi:hypothetical protein